MIYDVIKLGVPIWKYEKWDWVREDGTWKAEMPQNIEIKIAYANHAEVPN